MDELRPISSGLERLLRDMGMPEDLDLVRLAEEWDEVAGEPFAGQSRPTRYRDGELVITVADGAAASLLRFRLGDLVERIAGRFGAGSVTSVRIRVSRGKKGL